MTLGVIIGNRGFFPGHLCSEGRTEVLAALEQDGIRTVALPVDRTAHGAVESLADAIEDALHTYLRWEVHRHR